ncbi:MAG: hypothetical protein AAGG07_01885 [Planctomycetota bacterium]
MSRDCRQHETAPLAERKPRKLVRWARKLGIGALATAGVTWTVIAVGCVRLERSTPSFTQSRAEVRTITSRLESAPVELDRPVVLLSGYRAWPSMVGRVERRIRETTSGDRKDFLEISYPLGDDIDRIVERVVEKVDQRWPSDNPDETIEVDVIAISMGGLVARAASEPPAIREREGKRLNSVRVFTLASPHRGASLAERIALDTAAKSMRPGSEWLSDLNSRVSERDYELICYGQLRDGWVGATRTAPPGMSPYWTGGTRWFSHFDSATNPWFLADIALRLRGERPIARVPSTPPSD